MKIRIVAFDDRCIKDHGAVEGKKKTLCGRRLNGVTWFYRGNDDFKGDMKFHCSQCVMALRKKDIDSL